jgi:hypothetical protein
VLGEELKGIFVDVGPSLESGFKTAREDIDAWIKSLKGELADLNAWWEGHGDKAKPNPNPKILGPGDEGYNPIRGSASDIRGMGGETPGAEIRQEAIVYRATMRGTMEGSRQGFLAAFHELDDEKRGGGIQNASYGGGSGLGGGAGGGAGGRGGGAGGGCWWGCASAHP